MGVVNKLKLFAIFLIAPAFYGQLIFADPEPIEGPVAALDSVIYKPGNDLSLDFSVADIIGRMHELISADKDFPENELRNFNQLHESLISSQGDVPLDVIQNGIHELLAYIETNPGKYKEEIYQSAIANLQNFRTYLSDGEEQLDPSIKRSCKTNSCNPCNKNTCRPRLKCLVCRGPRGATGATGERGPRGLQGIQGVKGDQGEPGICQICCQCPPVVGGAASSSGVAQTSTNGCCISPCCPPVSCCPPISCCPPVSCCPVNSAFNGETRVAEQINGLSQNCVPLCCRFADGIINYVTDQGQINVMTQGRGFIVEALQIDPPTFIVRFLQPPFGTILVPLVSARIGDPRITNITTSSFVIINDQPVDQLNFVVFPLCR